MTDLRRTNQIVPCDDHIDGAILDYKSDEDDDFILVDSEGKEEEEELKYESNNDDNREGMHEESSTSDDAIEAEGGSDDSNKLLVESIDDIGSIGSCTLKIHDDDDDVEDHPTNDILAESYEDYDDEYHRGSLIIEAATSIEDHKFDRDVIAGILSPSIDLSYELLASKSNSVVVDEGKLSSGIFGQVLNSKENVSSSEPHTAGNDELDQTLDMNCVKSNNVAEAIFDENAPTKTDVYNYYREKEMSGKLIQEEIKASSIIKRQNHQKFLVSLVVHGAVVLVSIWFVRSWIYSTGTYGSNVSPSVKSSFPPGTYGSPSPSSVTNPSATPAIFPLSTLVVSNSSSCGSEGVPSGYQGSMLIPNEQLTEVNVKRRYRYRSGHRLRRHHLKSLSKEENLKAPETTDNSEVSEQESLSQTPVIDHSGSIVDYWRNKNSGVSLDDCPLKEFLLQEKKSKAVIVQTKVGDGEKSDEVIPIDNGTSYLQFSEFDERTLTARYRYIRNKEDKRKALVPTIPMTVSDPKIIDEANYLINRFETIMPLLVQYSNTDATADTEISSEEKWVPLPSSPSHPSVYPLDSLSQIPSISPPKVRPGDQGESYTAIPMAPAFVPFSPTSSDDNIPIASTSKRSNPSTDVIADTRRFTPSTTLNGDILIHQNLQHIYDLHRLYDYRGTSDLNHRHQSGVGKVEVDIAIPIPSTSHGLRKVAFRDPVSTTSTSYESGNGSISNSKARFATSHLTGEESVAPSTYAFLPYAAGPSINRRFFYRDRSAIRLPLSNSTVPLTNPLVPDINNGEGNVANSVPNTPISCDIEPKQHVNNPNESKLEDLPNDWRLLDQHSTVGVSASKSTSFAWIPGNGNGIPSISFPSVASEIPNPQPLLAFLSANHRYSNKPGQQTQPTGTYDSPQGTVSGFESTIQGEQVLPEQHYSYDEIPCAAHGL